MIRRLGKDFNPSKWATYIRYSKRYWMVREALGAGFLFALPLDFADTKYVCRLYKLMSSLLDKFRDDEVEWFTWAVEHNYSWTPRTMEPLEELEARLLGAGSLDQVPITGPICLDLPARRALVLFCV